jgi:hypothetical protein
MKSSLAFGIPFMMTAVASAQVIPPKMPAHGHPQPCERPKNNWCANEETCAKILSVSVRDPNAHLIKYSCSLDNGETADCSFLVKRLGLDLKGLSVKAIKTYVDNCKIMGACGPSSCMQIGHFVSLATDCQE